MIDQNDNTELLATQGKIGARCGIAGAVMLAMNNALSPFGYVLFFLSSVLLARWAKANEFGHQLEMQLVFTAINALGLYNWVLKPLLLG